MSTVSQISCQLSFYPLGTEQFNDVIEQVLDLIQKEKQLAIEINAFSTILKGEAPIIFALLEKITQLAQDNNWQFACNCTFSNTCGCAI